MKIKPGQWFVADIIGPGIYEMVKHGVNSANRYYAVVRLKKLFLKGVQDRGHETCCQPVDIDKWNHFKRVK